MNLVDIRIEIINYLSIKDIFNFLSIDQIGRFLLNDYSLWKKLALKYNLPLYPYPLNQIKDFKFNIKYYDLIGNKVNYLITQVADGYTININTYLYKKWISFDYLKQQLLISNITRLYKENLNNYYLENKKFLELYLSRASVHQRHYFALEFTVPKVYNSLLTSFIWTGITKEELYVFLFHFIYYININPLLIQECVSINLDL